MRLTSQPKMDGSLRVRDMNPLEVRIKGDRISGLFHPNISYSRWWFQIFVIFTPNLGEDEPILTSIFFKGVEITN